MLRSLRSNRLARCAAVLAVLGTAGIAATSPASAASPVSVAVFNTRGTAAITPGTQDACVPSTYVLCGSNGVVGFLKADSLLNPSTDRAGYTDTTLGLRSVEADVTISAALTGPVTIEFSAPASFTQGQSTNLFARSYTQGPLDNSKRPRNVLTYTAPYGVSPYTWGSSYRISCDPLAQRPGYYDTIITKVTQAGVVIATSSQVVQVPAVPKCSSMPNIPFPTITANVRTAGGAIPAWAVVQVRNVATGAVWNSCLAVGGKCNLTVPMGSNVAYAVDYIGGPATNGTASSATITASTGGHYAVNLTTTAG